MFYDPGMRVTYREEPCRSALNRVTGHAVLLVAQSVHGLRSQCTFCYVRAFELRADRPADDRYGSSIRVKTNVAEVLHCELHRPSWAGEPIAIGAATDPYQPAEGRYRLTRGCLEVLRDAAQDFSIITRGPLIVRDADLLAEAATPRRRLGHVLGTDARRRRLANDRARHRSPTAAAAGASRARRARRPSLGRHGAAPAGPLGPAGAARGRSSSPLARPAPAASGRTSCYLKPGTREHFLTLPRAGLAGAAAGVRAPLREPCLSPSGGGRAGPDRGEAPRAAARDPGPAGAGRPRTETGATVASVAASRPAIRALTDRPSRMGRPCQTRSRP